MSHVTLESQKIATECLSCHAFEEEELGSSADDCQVLMISPFSSSALEPFLVNVKRYLSRVQFMQQDHRLTRSIRRASKSVLLCNEQLFRQRPIGPKLVLPNCLRSQALEAIYDHISNWKAETSRQFLVNQYWWPSVTSGVQVHVNTCFGCQ